MDQPTTTASNFGSGNTSREIVQALRKTNKMERYKSHKQFLETCLKQQIIPKGMKVNFPITALPPDTSLLQDINKTLRNTEIAILRLCVKYYKISISKLTKELELSKAEMEKTNEPHKFLEYIKLLQRKGRNIQTECRKRKSRKLASLISNKATSSPANEVKRKNRHFRRKPITHLPEPTQVINISSVQLNPEQIKLLSFGPKFCPTPGSYNEEQLLEDTLEGLRRIRLKEFWFDEEVPRLIPTRPKFYRKNFWEPPKGRDEALDAYCSTIVSRVTSHVAQPLCNSSRNISSKGREALKQLRDLISKRVIRISPADKGGAVVVQDFSQYKQEAVRQLENAIHYQPLQQDPSREIARKSNELVEDLFIKELIDSKCRDWARVREDQVRTATFYHLPKVHKDHTNPPGRPIVSGVSGPTERLSKLVDHWLQPVVCNLPSYIKDTTHLLQTIEQWNNTITPLTEEIFIVTIDVTALYPSIPQNEVAPSLREMLGNQTPYSGMPPITTLLKVVDHILQNNVFSFDNKLYKQVQGTAMGTPMAPAIANLFMGCLESRLLSTSPWLIQRELWRRYIDDILLLWTLGEENLRKFLHWLNEQHQTIKFTWNYGRTNIPYLDVSISIVDGRLVTDLYVKPTDANMVLPFHSCHPRHCLRSIPFGQCLRLRRICSTDELFQQRSKELKQKLKRRGYPDGLLEASITKVANIPREDSLIYTVKNQQPERVPVVITHNPTHPPLGQWLKDLMPTLHFSRKMRKALPHPPIIGERNCHNLRRLLMPTKPPAVSQAQEEAEAGCYKCNATRCVICLLHLQQTSTFSSVRTGQRYTIRGRHTCKSTNLVYLIDCAKCRDVQYVGETGQTLQRRFHAHRSNIGVDPEKKKTVTTDSKNQKSKQDTLVARHFQGPGHTILDMRVTVIEKGTVEDAVTRKKRERYWRYKLKTNWPDGLNIFD